MQINNFKLPYEFELDENNPSGVFSQLSDSSTDMSDMYELGRRTKAPDPVKFLVHTSTIPYAHIWNIQNDDRDNAMYHSMNCHGCMMGSKPMFISPKCPCLDILDDDVEDVCFLTFIRTLNSNISMTELDAPDAKPSEFAFCKDSMNIFSHRYSGPMRRYLGLTGFEKVDSFESLHRVISSLYWFRYSKDHLKRCFSMHEKNFPNFLKSVKHTIYTINGLITKIFLLSCDFDYKTLAQRTAALFDDLLFDYSKRPAMKTTGLAEVVEESSSPYLQIKNYLNHVKTWFNRSDRSDRMKALEYSFTHKSVEDFIEMVTSSIDASCTCAYMLEGIDYTETLSWSFKMTELCQTRNLGYLPRRIAIQKNQEYRAHLDTKPAKPDEEKIAEIVKGIQTTLDDAKIPKNLFVLDEINPYEQTALLDEILQETDVPIKFSASYQNILKDGGRMEDARLLLQYCRDYEIKIAVRDLFTNEIKAFINARECRSESTVCFWFSYEICIRAINAEMKKLNKPPLYEETKYLVPSHYVENFFKAKILHIQEPGKQRNLVKSTSCLTWFLSLASKLTQATLSRIPEHKVGLTGSADAWKFQQQIHPAHGAGSFFDPGGRTSDSCFVYSDWVEATDYIDKLIGLKVLRTFLQYICFPRAYGKMIEFTVTWPQPVEETISLYEEDFNIDKSYKGFIRTGFMMGNPLTKTILHLIHVAEYGIAKRYFELKGITVQRDQPRRIQHIDSSKKFVSYINNRIL